MFFVLFVLRGLPPSLTGNVISGTGLCIHDGVQG
jgi:hypothetical protein